MLNQIYIRNFAIIDELELDFGASMTVLTGETGAGKSILVDALGLVLGDRADADVVRHGAERAEISANFDIKTVPAAQQWLSEHDLDDNDECNLRRVVSAEGRSKGYINGRPASLQLLKELGEMLVDIHGQHQHQSLFKQDVQRQLLDDYADCQAIAVETRNLYSDWKHSREQLETLRQNARDRDARLGLLRYHLDELAALALGQNELPGLEEEQRLLANGEHILSQCSGALNALDDDELASATGITSRALAILEQLRSLDPKLAGICDLISEANIQLQEASSELRDYVERMELDPERLNWVEQRLTTIHDLARKHHIEPDGLLQLQASFADELAVLENADVELVSLERQVIEFETRYRTAAAKLGQQRHKGAQSLSKAVTGIIKQLGMPAGEFRVQLNPRDDQAPHRHGLETISFEVAANPGQPAKPLAKVASGGELSRISLAIQVLLSSSQRIPTLIFDEVDTGIGGAVAETVGRQLRTLGNSHQVMCVTHLPQVAALGHHHYQVSKAIAGNTTRTEIRKLDEKARQEEIARMLGGMEITQQTRAHAEEMISRAEALA